MLAGETPHVYFDPPELVKMVYPCFVYHFTGYQDKKASDKVYLTSEQYSVRYITKNADPLIPKALKELPHAVFDRHYTADNLHHFMFTFQSMYYYTPSGLDLSQITSSFLGGNND